MKSERRERFILIVDAVVLLIAGFDAILIRQFVIGVPALLASVINLISARFVSRSPRFTAVIVQVMNALVAGSMALAAVNSGKHYLQYAWLVAAVFSLGAAVVSLRVSLKPSPSDHQQPQS